MFNDNYCSKWPNWLRYVLVLPAAIICSVLVGMLFPLACVFYLERNSIAYDFIYTVSGAVSFIFSALYILYTMPPKHKLWFLMIPNVIWFVLVCFQFILMYYNPSYYAWTNWLSMTTEAITCIVVACVCIKRTLENNLKISEKDSAYQFIKEKADSLGLTTDEYIEQNK